MTALVEVKRSEGEVERKWERKGQNRRSKRQITCSASKFVGAKRLLARREGLWLDVDLDGGWAMEIVGSSQEALPELAGRSQWTSALEVQWQRKRRA